MATAFSTFSSMMLSFFFSDVSMCSSTCFASSSVIGWFVRVENASMRTSAPSSVLIFEMIRDAIKFATSSLRFIFCCSAFFLRIAIFVSRSGVCISATRPHSIRDFSRPCSPVISFGKVSLDRTICLWLW